MLLKVIRSRAGQATERRLLITAVKPLVDATLISSEDIDGDVNDEQLPRRRRWKPQPLQQRQPPVVHFIVPVARLSSRFDDFIANFEHVCLQTLHARKSSSDDVTTEVTTSPKCALLLVVFDGPSNLDKDTATNVESHLTRLRRIYGEIAVNARLIRTKNAFTRALGMDLAARQLPPEALIFFVDVDVNFDADFIDNCRLLTERGKVVYYPIVFSQYDPAIVGNYSNIASPKRTEGDKNTKNRANTNNKKPLPDMNVISKLTGHWIVYGFGMVCLYKSDYDAVGGYDLTIRGWGGEDVALYDSHVRHASIAVLRACEPGLVHRYHERFCDPGLGEDQLRMCRGAAAESLGSRAQLANLVAESRKDGKWRG